MTKGELNIAVAELQQKVNRIEATRSKALKTASAAVDRKYAKHVVDLLMSQKLVSVNGHEQLQQQYVQEVVSRVELPSFCVEDLEDSAVHDLGAETGPGTEDGPDADGFKGGDARFELGVHD